jgi:hypothetical protein
MDFEELGANKLIGNAGFRSRISAIRWSERESAIKKEAAAKYNDLMEAHQDALKKTAETKANEYKEAVIAELYGFVALQETLIERLLRQCKAGERSFMHIFNENISLKEKIQETISV